MKIRINFGHIILAVFGVTLCLGNTMSAAEPSKRANTQDLRGSVTGQLGETVCDQLVYGAGETVTLTPISPAGGRALTTKADGEGRFAFRNLPRGLYEVRSQVSWTTSRDELEPDGLWGPMYTDHTQPVVARIQVIPGQKAHPIKVNEPPIRDGGYSYGGNPVRPHHTLVKCG